MKRILIPCALLLTTLFPMTFSPKAWGNLNSLANVSTAKIQLKNNKQVKIYIAASNKEQLKGLSGIADDKFSNDEGMLFYYPDDGLRGFWMPDTYFDLDIYFLDKNLTVVARELGVKHHPGLKEPPPIAKTKQYLCRYVLELKADSKLSRSLKVGDKIKWLESKSLSEIVSGTRSSK